MVGLAAYLRFLGGGHNIGGTGPPLQGNKPHFGPGDFGPGGPITRNGNFRRKLRKRSKPNFGDGLPHRGQHRTGMPTLLKYRYELSHQRSDLAAVTPIGN